MTTTRIQQLRLRLAGKTANKASAVLLPKIQTELSANLYHISERLEDGTLSSSERTATILELTELRDDIDAVLEVLRQEQGGAA